MAVIWKQDWGKPGASGPRVIQQIRDDATGEVRWFIRDHSGPYPAYDAAAELLDKDGWRPLDAGSR